MICSWSSTVVMSLIILKIARSSLPTRQFSQGVEDVISRRDRRRRVIRFHPRRNQTTVVLLFNRVG